MAIFGGGGAPTPPPVPKPIPPPMQPPPPAEIFDKKRRQLQGIASTILTGPQGDLTPARTTRKSLLGGS